MIYNCPICSKKLSIYISKSQISDVVLFCRSSNYKDCDFQIKVDENNNLKEIIRARVVSYNFDVEILNDVVYIDRNETKIKYSDFKDFFDENLFYNLSIPRIKILQRKFERNLEFL